MVETPLSSPNVASMLYGTKMCTQFPLIFKSTQENDPHPWFARVIWNFWGTCKGPKTMDFYSHTSLSLPRTIPNFSAINTFILIHQVGAHHVFLRVISWFYSCMARTCGVAATMYIGMLILEFSWFINTYDIAVMAFVILLHKEAMG